MSEEPVQSMFAELAKLFGFREGTNAFRKCCELLLYIQRNKCIYIREIRNDAIARYVMNKLHEMGIVKIKRETRTKRGKVEYRYKYVINEKQIEKIIGLFRLLL